MIHMYLFNTLRTSAWAGRLRLMKIAMPMMVTNNNTIMHNNTAPTIMPANVLIITITRKHDFINIFQIQMQSATRTRLPKTFFFSIQDFQCPKLDCEMNLGTFCQFIWLLVSFDWLDRLVHVSHNRHTYLGKYSIDWEHNYHICSVFFTAKNHSCLQRLNQLNNTGDICFGNRNCMKSHPGDHAKSIFQSGLWYQRMVKSGNLVNPLSVSGQFKDRMINFNSRWWHGVNSMPLQIKLEIKKIFPVYFIEGDTRTVLWHF